MSNLRQTKANIILQSKLQKFEPKIISSDPHNYIGCEEREELRYYMWLCEYYRFISLKLENGIRLEVGNFTELFPIRDEMNRLLTKYL